MDMEYQNTKSRECFKTGQTYKRHYILLTSASLAPAVRGRGLRGYIGKIIFGLFFQCRYLLV